MMIYFSIRPNIGTYDHRVRDRAILPGAAYLECIHAYSKLMNATLTIAQSACFNAPCLLTTPESARVSQSITTVWALNV